MFPAVDTVDAIFSNKMVAVPPSGSSSGGAAGSLSNPRPAC